MKKCPMMFSTDGKTNTLNMADCIGYECAAYVERSNNKDGGLQAIGFKTWSCAALNREVWNDVEHKE
jgi:hypothetical protein